MKNRNSWLTIVSFFVISVRAEHTASMMVHTHDAEESMMHGMYGSYPMTRESSGTSWVPNSSPVEGIHVMRDPWMFMFLGYSYLVVDDQRGPRGGKKLFDDNMLMFMAQRNFKRYTFAFRSMFSLEEGTIGNCGYPLLLQTGETCNGKTPLIDKQHPHNLLMELALVNTLQYSETSSFFLYTALPGEPALGPPVYIMRFSSEYIPETPITHHWIDSTHITFGVITAGWIYNNMYKMELCGFRGREPNQHRWSMERPKIDSYSVRFSWNPTENFAFQASYGFIKSREQLTPQVNTNRYVVSGIYNRAWEHGNVQATAIIGVNEDKPGHTLPAFSLEATAEIHTKHLCFGRFETVKKDDLFVAPSPLADKIFNVHKLTLGYVYEWITGPLKWGLGGLVDFPMVPSHIASIYGSDTSFAV
ncbi:MAG: hypothetical protein ACHQVS_05360, partial [Candidatus Babeliales bacterium]